MRVADALKKIRKEFTNRMHIDKTLFANVTNELFQEQCKWDSEMLLRMEASISSAQYTTPLPGISNSQPFKSKGYKPNKFLISHFRCLLEVYAKCIHGNYPDLDVNLIEKELDVVYNLVQTIKHRQNNTKEDHLKLLKNIFKKLMNGEIKDFCYNSGYRGHSFYIHYFQKNKVIYAVICNLGAGKSYHKQDSKNPKLYYPRVLKIEDINKHIKAVYKAKMTASKKLLTPQAKQKLLKSIYKSGKPQKNRLSHDFAQTTSNCVVKNYLQSVLYRLNDRTKYTAIVNAVRSTLGSHIAELHAPTLLQRDVTTLNNSLANSQLPYQCSSCDQLVDSLNVYRSQVAIEKIAEPSTIDPTVAATLGGAGTGLLAGYVAHQLVKNSKMTENEKSLVVVASGLFFGFLGGKAAHSYAQPTITERLVVAEDARIPANQVMACKPAQFT